MICMTARGSNHATWVITAQALAGSHLWWTLNSGVTSPSRSVRRTGFPQILTQADRLSKHQDFFCQGLFFKISGSPSSQPWARMTSSLSLPGCGRGSAQPWAAAPGLPEQLSTGSRDRKEGRGSRPAPNFTSLPSLTAGN